MNTRLTYGTWSIRQISVTLGNDHREPDLHKEIDDEDDQHDDVQCGITCTAGGSVVAITATVCEKIITSVTNGETKSDAQANQDHQVNGLKYEIRNQQRWSFPMYTQNQQNPHRQADKKCRDRVENGSGPEENVQSNATSQ